jgi:hypothetical protein
VLAKHLYAVAVVDHERDAALLMYYGGDVAELLLAVALFAAFRSRSIFDLSLPSALPGKHS